MADGILTIGADVSPMMRDVRSAYDKLQREIASKGFSIDTSRAGRSLASLTQQSERLARSLTRSAEVFLSIASVSSAIYGTQRAFVALVQSVRETELAFAQIQSILQASSSSFKSFQSDLFRIANQTGTAFSQAAEVANEFARQGLSLNDTLKATNDALTLVRLSGLSTAEAVSSLTAQVNTFKKEALTTTQAVERLATVAAAYAVSENDLALALQRTGAAAADAGVEYNQLIAVVTALQQRTARGGSVIGNGLKSIFTRVQSTETLDLLEELGVRVRELDGETRPVLDILDDLADKFQGLSSAQKSAVTEATAGIYQINTLQALLSDLSSAYSTYEGALNKASESTDQANIRNERLNQTLDALFVRTGNNVQKFNSTLGTLTIEPVVRRVLDGLNSIFEGFDKFKDTEFGETLLKGIGEVLSGPALALVATTMLKIGIAVSKGFATALKDLTALSGFGAKYKITQEQITAVLKSQDEVHQRIIASARTEQQQAEAILRVARMISAEYKEAATYFNLTTANVNRVAQGRPVRARAGGFLPVAAAISEEQKLIKQGVGGASSSARPVVLKDFNTGKGRETVVANTDEVIVRNFNGTGASAILTKDMVEKLGGLSAVENLGKVSRVENAARGLVGADSKIMPFSLENALKAVNLKEFSKELDKSIKTLKKEIKVRQTETETYNPRQISKAKRELKGINTQLAQGALLPRALFSKEREAELLARKSKAQDIISGVPKDLRKLEAKLAETQAKKDVVSTAARRQTKSQRQVAIDYQTKITNKKAEAEAKKANREKLALQKKLLQEEEAEYKKYVEGRAKKDKRKSFAERYNRENAPAPLTDADRVAAIEKNFLEKQKEQELIAQARQNLGLDKPETFDDKLDKERERRRQAEEARVIKSRLNEEERLARAAKIKQVREDRARLLASKGRTLLQAGTPEYQARLEEVKTRLAQSRADRFDRIEDKRLGTTKEERLRKQKSARFNASLERASIPALFLSLGIPMLAEGFKNGKGGNFDKGVDTASTALSVGGSIFSAFPNKVGAGAGILAALGIGAKGTIDILGQRDDKSPDILAKEAEELSNKNNEVVNSVRAYIAAQGQLEDAINSGASSEAINSLTRAVSDALFSIEGSDIRGRIKSGFTGEKRYENAQQIVDELISKDRPNIEQTNFAANLGAIDKELTDFGDKLARAFGGSTQNLETVALTEGRGLVAQLLRALGPSEKFGENITGAADKLFSGELSSKKFLESIGLSGAAETLSNYNKDLGRSADLLVRMLALEIKEAEITQDRLAAEKALTEITIVAKKDLEKFSQAVLSASSIATTDRKREFDAQTQKLANRTISGINPVADVFSEFNLNKRNLFSDTRQSTADLRQKAFEDITNSITEGKLSDDSGQKLFNSLQNSLRNFEKGDLGFEDVIKVLQDTSKKDEIFGTEFIKSVYELGKNFESGMDLLSDKLKTDLDKIKNANLATLFGGTGAIQNQSLFSAGEGLFGARLNRSAFNTRKTKPRTKEEKQAAAVEGFKLISSEEEAILKDFNERVENGVLTSDVASRGAEILSSSASPEAKKLSLDTLSEKLGLGGVISAQENFIKNSASKSFQNSFNSFLGQVDKTTSSKGSFQKQVKEIREALARGVPFGNISLGGLGSTISGNDTKSRAAFGLLRQRQLDLFNQTSNAKGAAKQAVESKVGIEALKRAAETGADTPEMSEGIDKIKTNTENSYNELVKLNTVTIPSLQKSFELSSITTKLRTAELNKTRAEEILGKLNGPNEQLKLLEQQIGLAITSLAELRPSDIREGNLAGEAPKMVPALSGEERTKVENSLKELKKAKEQIVTQIAELNKEAEKFDLSQINDEIKTLDSEWRKRAIFGPPESGDTPTPSPEFMPLPAGLPVPKFASDGLDRALKGSVSSVLLPEDTLDSAKGVFRDIFDSVEKGSLVSDFSKFIGEQFNSFEDFIDLYFSTALFGLTRGSKFSKTKVDEGAIAGFAASQADFGEKNTPSWSDIWSRRKDLTQSGLEQLVKKGESDSRLGWAQGIKDAISGTAPEEDYFPSPTTEPIVPAFGRPFGANPSFTPTASPVSPKGAGFGVQLGEARPASVGAVKKPQGGLILNDGQVQSKGASTVEEMEEAANNAKLEREEKNRAILEKANQVADSRKAKLEELQKKADEAALKRKGLTNTAPIVDSFSGAGIIKDSISSIGGVVMNDAYVEGINPQKVLEGASIKAAAYKAPDFVGSPSTLGPISAAIPTAQLFDYIETSNQRDLAGRIVRRENTMNSPIPKELVETVKSGYQEIGGRLLENTSLGPNRSAIYDMMYTPAPNIISGLKGVNKGSYQEAVAEYLLRKNEGGFYQQGFGMFNNITDETNQLRGLERGSVKSSIYQRRNDILRDKSSREVLIDKFQGLGGENFSPLEEYTKLTDKLDELVQTISTSLAKDAGSSPTGVIKLELSGFEISVNSDIEAVKLAVEKEVEIFKANLKQTVEETVQRNSDALAKKNNLQPVVR